MPAPIASHACAVIIQWYTLTRVYGVPALAPSILNRKCQFMCASAEHGHAHFLVKLSRAVQRTID
jgi:hypothetical protein